MFEKLRSFFSRSATLEAASQLSPIGPPKVRPGVASFPSFFTSTKPSTSVLPMDERRLASTDVTSFRNGPDTRKVIRDFVFASPDLSAARETTERTR